MANMTCTCGHKAYVHALYAYTDPAGSQLGKEDGRQCGACACSRCVIAEAEAA